MTSLHFAVGSSVIIGMIVGVVASLVLIFKNKDAVLGVNTADPEKDTYNFVILCPLDDLRKKKYLIVEVKNIYAPKYEDLIEKDISRNKHTL